jgi:hypothetical protein
MALSIHRFALRYLSSSALQKESSTYSRAELSKRELCHRTVVAQLAESRSSSTLDSKRGCMDMQRIGTAPTGRELAAIALVAVRQRDGTAAALEFAEELVSSACAIYACELGTEATLDILERAALVLPD